MEAMRGYLLRRVAVALAMSLGVSVLVFFLIHVVPGDPTEIMLGETAAMSDREALRKELGLDRPLSEQLYLYLAALFQGDLGRSLHTKEKVLDEILLRFPATLALTAASLIIAITISIPLGVLAASHWKGAVDSFASTLSLLGLSMPSFWLGPMLIIYLAINLDWFPASGSGSVRHVVLPALTLGTGMAALLTRMTRSSLLDVMTEEYVRTARAKGLGEWKVWAKHGLRNALIPLITLLGLQFGSLLTGSIITETIFAWPGLGRLTLKAIQSRDYPMVQGCVLLIALCHLGANLIADICYTVADPRIRYAGKR
jgi:peptide/nickel transport system permease protein